MKKYIVLIVLLNSFINASEFSNESIYRVPITPELLEPGIEHGAYEDFLRVINEINKDTGGKIYFGDKNNSFSQKYDNLDIVPIAQFTHSGKDLDYGESIKTPILKDKIYSLYDFMENPNKFLEPNESIDLKYAKMGSDKRFYFGNGNKIKDIIILDKNNSNNLDKKDILYDINGVYKSISPRSLYNLNPLKITLDEYHNIIENKPKTDLQLLEFLQNKLKTEMNIDSHILNGELYTEDKNGFKHRVLWDFEPLSIPNGYHFTDKDSDQRYRNEVLNSVYVFSPIDVGGNIAYTKDLSIIIQNQKDTQDSLAFIDNATIKGTVDDFKKIFQEDPNSIKLPLLIKNYLNDKNTLTDAELEAKYGNSVITSGDFQLAYENFKNELGTAIIEKENKEKLINSQKDALMVQKGELENKLPWDYFKYTSSWYTDEEKKKYFDSQTLEVQNLLVEYKKLDDEEKLLDLQKENLLTEINETIPKKYGFYNGENATEEDKKYISKIIKDSDILIYKASKNIEFRGKGRVDGTIDLGLGENYLTIAEQFTGNYGTNITFGSNVVLKNIKAIKIGSQMGDGYGLSGKTSLSIEIDPNKLDLEGYLYKHALANTWSDTNKIIFSSSDPIYRYANDFGIELKISTLSKDNIINMGRPLVYKANPLDYDLSAEGSPKTNELMEYKIPLYSDSIAHNLNVLEKTSNEGHSLVQVKVLDKIKRLNDKENEVYKSIKDSGYLGILSDTLSSSTKKTIFSAEEDLLEEKKVVDFVNALVGKQSASDVIDNLGHFNFNKEKKDVLIQNIQDLRELPNVKAFDGKVNTLKKYQEFNYQEILNAIDKMKLDSLVLDNKIVDENINSKEGLEKETAIKNKIDELKAYYIANIEEQTNKLKELSPTNSNEIIKEADNLIKVLDGLTNVDDGWWWTSEDILINYVRNFTIVKDRIQKLQNVKSSDLAAELVKELEKLKYQWKENYSYKNLVENLYFTKREEESLRELKTLLAEIYEKNIYSEVNKISKNGLEVFTPLAFNPQNKPHAGVISGRYSKDKFKGNIYTAYGVYEFSNDLNSSGFIVGGGSSNHKEVKNDTLKQLTTESKISGKRAYLGVFNNHHINDNFSNIFGLGVQYSKYKVDRDFRNNYQRELYKGKLNTIDLNVYAGGVFKYNLDDDLVFNTKALLSYMLVHQGKVSEEKQPLSMNIDKKNFSYLDASMGVGLAKMIYSDDSTSSISADVYGIYGIYGYNNDNLRARFDDSTTDFDILGNKYKRSSMKIELEYNVLKTNGFDYGLSGNYITNANENNIAIKFKAGYKF